MLEHAYHLYRGDRLVARVLHRDLAEYLAVTCGYRLEFPVTELSSSSHADE